MKTEKPKNVKKSINFLFSYLKPYRLRLVFILVFIILSTLFTIYSMSLIGKAIDVYLVNLDKVGFSKLLFLMVLCFVSNALFTWLQNRLMLSLSQKTIFDMRNDLFQKIQTLPISFFDETPHGDILSRATNDIDNISQAFNNGINQMISSLFSLSLMFLVMIFLSPILTIVNFVTIPVILFFTKQVSRASKKYFLQQQSSLGDLNSYIEEMLSAQKLIAINHQEKKAVNDFDAINVVLRKHSVKAQIFSSMMMPIAMVVNNLGFVLIISVGSLLILKNFLTIGKLTTFSQFAKQFSRPLSELANQMSLVQSALASSERVSDMMEIDLTDAPSTKEIPILRPLVGKVQFEDVSFSYDGKKQVLKHLSLLANPGQTIAIVGPTGAGKTTIINLLNRFYDISDGKILIDDQEIKAYKTNDLRRHVSVVLQDSYLFNETILNNLKVGKENATREEIVSACKMANAHDFIKRLPQAYDFMISEGGNNLSQGQRQMLCIARTILSDPDILILDEATSSVDTRTERNIQSAMNRLMKGRTSFVIAHRLSTIVNADRIIVIVDGEIEEQGNHKELMDKKGFYYGLYRSLQ